ncbi:LacI family DNA-binding transcriptional regulator [Streptomyces mutabilis]|uniref:LacI family DNA-binding transcriptional regulator n=1 Tax=Streptomyces mutabilis TaxID=67332 RepID=UPI00339DBD59
MTASRNGRPRRAADQAAGSPAADERRVTIQDVAREAGVSMSAVSKVLRDAYGVSDSMRAKVNSAIETLDYRPNASARAMRGRSYTLGVMLVEMSSPFQSQVVDGISQEVAPTPYQEVLIASGTAPERQKRCIEALVDRQVDGLIVIAPWTSTEWLEKLGARMPMVVLARHGGATNFDTVVNDDFEGARLMVDHLVAAGHRRIVHTGPTAGGLTRPFVLSHTVRRDGYEDAMRRHGLEPDVIVAEYTEEGGYAAACEALDRPVPPTAIFAGADISALGALRAAEERGVRVPEDLSVAGYDNIYASTIGRVSLTTIDQSAHLTGARSARLLLERIKGRTQPVQYMIAPRLIARSTTAPPRQ